MTDSYTVSDEETREVIGDFLEKGLVDDIISMFKQDLSLYAWSGQLLDDERFVVRMGMAILFETLAEVKPDEIRLALDSLIPLLDQKTPSDIRGEAATIVGIINNGEARDALQPLRSDPGPQVREIVIDVLW